MKKSPHTYSRRKFLNKEGHGRIHTGLYASDHCLEATLEIADCRHTAYIDVSAYMSESRLLQTEQHVRQKIAKIALIEAELKRLREAMEAAYTEWVEDTVPRLLVEQAERDAAEEKRPRGPYRAPRTTSLSQLLQDS